MKILVSVFLCLFSVAAFAQLTPIEQICKDYCSEEEPKPVEVKPTPNGIYVSASSVTPSKPAVDPALIELNHVEGTLVRILWSYLNPEEGVYDWTLLDRELATASPSSKISIAIPDSKSMPQFVLGSCETFGYSFRNAPVSTCLPWDTEYLRHKDAFVQALGERYDSNPNVSAVYFSYAAMGNGLEMHFRVSEVQFSAAGYTAERLLLSYNAVMDSYVQAFPTTPIIMEVHEVFGKADLAIGAYEHCYNSIGNRCGVAAWWCASRMALDPKSSEFEVAALFQEAASQSFGVCQTIGNFTRQPDRFGEGTTAEVAAREIKYWTEVGVTAFEIWILDITNEQVIVNF